MSAKRLLSPFVRAEPPPCEVIEDTETLPSSYSSSTSEEMGHHNFASGKLCPAKSSKKRTSDVTLIRAAIHGLLCRLLLLLKLPVPCLKYLKYLLLKEKHWDY